MQPTAQINKLWDEFRAAITRTYAEGQKQHSGDGHAECNALKDYAQDVSGHDDLAALLGREAANERQHRSGEPRKFPVNAASKLIIMNMAALGARQSEMPPATLFLTARQTAAEAEVIGYLCRGQLSQEWQDALAKLDYAKLMAGE